MQRMTCLRKKGYEAKFKLKETGRYPSKNVHRELKVDKQIIEHCFLKNGEDCIYKLGSECREYTKKETHSQFWAM